MTVEEQLDDIRFAVKMVLVLIVIIFIFQLWMFFYIEPFNFGILNGFLLIVSAFLVFLYCAYSSISSSVPKKKPQTN
ncbi:MAG: hypothetical protein ACFFF4_14210 [Candidatus Thorarchaeota archaeon]